MGNSDAHFPKSGEQVVEEAISAKVAILAVGGRKVTQIAKELDISPNRVKRILGSDDCIAHMQSIEREALSAAKSRIKVGTAELADLILDAIKTNLRDGNIQAVMPALKILGLAENDNAPAQDNKLIVVMPGAEDPRTINVTPRNEE